MKAGTLALAALAGVTGAAFTYAAASSPWAFIGLFGGSVAVLVLRRVRPQLGLPLWATSVIVLLAPILPIVALGTSRIGPLAAVAVGLVVAPLGWYVVLDPTLKAGNVPVRVILVPLVVGLLSGLVGYVTSGGSLAAGGLVAALGVWALAIGDLVYRLFARAFVSVRPGPQILTAVMFLTLSLGLASRNLAQVDGRLANRVDAIASRSTATPVRTMRALRDPDPVFRDLMLSRAFAPRLFLPSDQELWPLHPWVDSYNSMIYGLAGADPQARVTWPRLPSRCRRLQGQQNDPDTCYVLSDGCFTPDAAVCGQGIQGRLEFPYGLWVPPGGSYEPGGMWLRPYGVTYARVIRRTWDGNSDTETEESQREAFKNVELAEQHFPGDEVTTLIQYWLYYPYNYFEAETPLGTIIQEHESDWEVISVALSRDKPLFVAFNAHCGGQWFPWKDVPTVSESKHEYEYLRTHAISNARQGRELDALAASGRIERTHPAVMIAEGSHGSYPASGEIRVPDWTSCVLNGSFGDVLTYAAAAKEKVSVDIEVVPVEIKAARADFAPMEFAGHWGLNDRAHLKLPFGIDWNVIGGKTHPGPKTPRFQDVWNDPFWVYFKKPTWHRGSAG